jgi:hypothetical protein
MFESAIIWSWHWETRSECKGNTNASYGYIKFYICYNTIKSIARAPLCHVEPEATTEPI